MEPIAILLLGVAAIAAVAVLWWLAYSWTAWTFMVDSLGKHGGSIVCQGVEYVISKDAKITIGLGYITVTEKDCKIRFRAGSVFTPPPVIKINREVKE